MMGLGVSVANFLERAAHSNYSMFNLCSVDSFSYSPFWFRGNDASSNCTGSWPLLTFTYLGQIERF